MADELENKAEDVAPPEEKGGEKDPAENQKEVKTEEQLREEIKAELRAEAHKENSKLGRRLSAMEEQMNTFLEQATNIFSNVGKQPQAQEEVSEDEYLTIGQLRKIEAEKQRKEAETKTLYGKTYIKHIKTIGDREGIDEDLHLQALKLTTDDDGKFNLRSHADPSAAAEINYLKALNYLHSNKKSGKERVPDQHPGPGGSATKVDSKSSPEIELDEEAKEYAKRRDIPLDKVKKMLNDKTPIYSQGGVLI